MVQQLLTQCTGVVGTVKAILSPIVLLCDLQLSHNVQLRNVQICLNDLITREPEHVDYQFALDSLRLWTGQKIYLEVHDDQVYVEINSTNLRDWLLRERLAIPEV